MGFMLYFLLSINYNIAINSIVFFYSFGFLIIICLANKNHIMIRTLTLGLLLILSSIVFGQSLLSEEELDKQEVYTDYEKALKNTAEVIIIDLSSQGLDAVPKTIYRFRNLQVLILSDNQITELPESLRKLRKLQKLYVDHNNIENLYFNTSDGRSFENLEEIYAGYNPLKTIPENLKDFELLKVSLAGCKYLDLKNVFTPLARILTLESLDLSELNLDTIPFEVANLAGLRSLDLSSNPSMAWDTSFRFISQNKNIVEIIMQNNKLSRVPEELKLFENLQSVDLSNNDKLRLDEVINLLTDVKFLNYLKLSDCKINKIPKNIGNLKSLWELDLSHNDITFLPREIGGIVQLEEIDLRYNEIQELPEEFAYLLNLEKIYLSNNPLEFMPEGMSNMKDMKYLEVPKKTLEKNVKKSLKGWFPNAEIVYVKSDEGEDDY